MEMDSGMLEKVAQANALLREAVLDRRDGEPPMLTDEEGEEFEWLTGKIEVELSARLMLVEQIDGEDD
jgi:hypothetical protein